MNESNNSHGLSIQLGKIQSFQSCRRSSFGSKQNTPKNYLSPRFLDDYDNIDPNLLLDAFSDSLHGNQYVDVFGATPSSHDINVQYHNMSMLPDAANAAMMNESLCLIPMYEEASKTLVGANKRSRRNIQGMKQAEVFQNKTKKRGNTRKKGNEAPTGSALSKLLKSKAPTGSALSKLLKSNARIGPKATFNESVLSASYFAIVDSMDSVDSHLVSSGLTHSKTPQVIAKERRRERNRVLARKTRAKKKVELEILRDQLDSLQTENTALRDIVVTKLPDTLQKLLATDSAHISDYIEKKFNSSQRMLKKVDVSSVVMGKIKNLQSSFVICSCTEPNTPIVYASPAFMQLSGYKCDQVMGKNLFFLAGADTNSGDLNQIRRALTHGMECRKIMLNYKFDGTKFYTLMQMSPLISFDNTMTLAIGVFVEINVPPGKEDIVEKFNGYHYFDTNSLTQRSFSDSLLDGVSGATTSDHNSSSGSGNNRSDSSSDNKNDSDTSSCGDQDDQRSTSETISRRW